MLSLFRRCLPDLTRTPVRVSACRMRGTPKRVGGRFRAAWQVTVHSNGGPPEEVTVVGTAPVADDFLSPELLRLCRVAAGQPRPTLFERFAVHVEHLDLALVVFPVDPVLHGLVEITGEHGPALLTQHLDECRSGARVTGLRWELRRYAPCRSCELSLTAALVRSEGESVRRVRAKAFADDRGRDEHESLRTVWEAADDARHLRVPRPLGYDDERRLLFIGDLPGPGGLAEWIHCLERSRPLPSGTSPDRVVKTIDELLAGVGELQRSPVEAPRERSFRRELAVLHRHADQLHSMHPILGGSVTGVLERLGAAEFEEDDLVPAHGTLRPSRTAGADDRLVLFGWDQLCLASRALDPATFIARIRQAPIQHPGRAAELDQLAETVRMRACKKLGLSHVELAVYEAVVLLRHAVGILRRHTHINGASGRARRLIAAAGERATQGLV